MIPVDQHVTGPRGSCMAACLASLLELPIQAVPHEAFLRQPGDTGRFQWAERLDAWLSQFGLYALHFMADPRSAIFPGCYHIITGISLRGRPHACVGWGPEVVHDPHPDKTGLSEIDGFVLLVPTWSRGSNNPEANSRKLEEFQRSAEHILEDVGAFYRSLGPRDLLLVQIGLHASHMEEAITAGDELRAKSHLHALTGLVGRLRAEDGAG